LAFDALRENTMADAPSKAIKLYGTDEPVEAPIVLNAGPLSAELEAGNLRYIRFGGKEVMRAISFIVRDKDWGTYNPVIDDLDIDQTGSRFRVTYKARTGNNEQGFRYDAVIEGSANGELVFSGKGEAVGDFLTNRTGFVVLHPVDGVAGAPVEITHTTGKTVAGHFPELIDPMQPMMDLRTLKHSTPDGLSVTCTMEGDTYEMEDQRNWTDASYKTYVRPLALPWPYTLKRGEKVDQTIRLKIDGRVSSSGEDSAISVAVGAPRGIIPALGMGLDPDDTEATIGASEVLRQIGARHLICHYDPRRGHDKTTLARQVEAARALGTEPWLEAVLTSVEDCEAEVNELGKTVADLGHPFTTVLLSPGPDMKSTLPGSIWPKTPPADAIARAARRAFPKAWIGGGMFSYFTELNRKRPPAELLDLVSFTTSPMVHAGDDRSVVESLQALPSVIKSVKAIAGGKPYAVGPSAIGMRSNPYGAAPKQNPDNIRQAMNWNDPRQRGLLGAAWNLGYFAHLAYGDATAVALGAPTGAFGTVSAKSSFPQPWYDRAGGVYPVYHVLRGFAQLAGKPLRALSISQTDKVAGLAVGADRGVEIWLANLGPEAVEIDLDAQVDRVAVLDAAGFTTAASDPAFMDTLAPLDGPALQLDAYAVVRIKTSA
jgi:hypothetical protein